MNICMNVKDGMENEEFEKYVTNSIIPLHPNTKDPSGHCIMIKAHSVPGKIATNILVKLYYLGFILILGVSNSAVVTQEMDKNYVLFKT